MAVFLVDYENVSFKEGLKGANCLNENDKVILFYSNACPSIRRDEMNAIFNSGCEFKTYKLVNAHKNALDFYIAAEVGALAENGENQMAIISNDNGFNAVTDFMNIKYSLKVTTVKAPNIEIAITMLNSKDDKMRRNALKANMGKLDIGQEYALYQQRNAFKASIKNALLGTDYENRTAEIIQYVSNHKENLEHEDISKKNLYTESLHIFGRDDGVAIYRILRDVI
jgi:hypothetical protein